MYFYKCIGNDKLYAAYEIGNACEMFGINAERAIALYFEPVNLSVIDLLKDGLRIKAIQQYRDIHHSTLAEARDMVDKIQKDMEKYAK